MKDTHNILFTMTQEIFIRLFKNCYTREDFSPFKSVEIKNIPNEYQELIESVKLLMESKKEVNATNLFELSKNKSILAKYMELCNKIDKQTYGII